MSDDDLDVARGIWVGCCLGLMLWIVAAVLLGCSEPACTPGESVVADDGSLWVCATPADVVRPVEGRAL